MNKNTNYILKNTKSFILKRRRYYSRTKAFKRKYENIDKSLFNNTLDKKVIKEYKDKWKVFGVKVEIDTFLLCYNLSGKIDYNIVPENIFAAIIEPSLNKYKDEQLSFIPVKNIYEKWFDNKSVFPKSYFHKIDNIYYDEKLRVIDDIDYYLEGKFFQYPLICKPSLGSSRGLGMKFIDNLDEIKESLNNGENLVYQEKIIQNKSIDKINPGMSIIRTCLYRAADGKFKVLSNSICFGVDGSLDNVSAGGIACNIQEDGMLNDYAVKKYCEKHILHPDSKVRFSKVKIPFYDKLFEVSEAIANEIPMCNLVSFDMCLDVNNNWRCIEINLKAQSIHFPQYAGKGFFGPYTDEVIYKIANDKGAK